MLLDEEMREPLDAGAADAGRIARGAERLLLRLAVGAATERLWLSYPRLEVGGARPRVPSFYVLDVMRAITGQHPATTRRCSGGRRGKAARSLEWPAPARPGATRSTTSSTISRRCAS